MFQYKSRNISKVAKQTFNAFLDRSTLHGFQYLTPRHNRSLLERCIWWLVQLAALYSAGFLVLSSWDEFMSNPTVITLTNPSYPTNEINFPGISICNLNKISRRRAYEYTRNLSIKSNISILRMTGLLKYFGKIYDFGSTIADESLIEYNDILEMYDRYPTNGSFNPYMTFKKLAPPCSDLISDCVWAGKNYNCSDLFVFEATMEGFCCIFNYAPPTVQKRIIEVRKSKKKILRPVGEGMGTGLIVKVHPHPEDYLHPSIASVGANIHVFNSDEFPDSSSGGMKQRLLPLGIELIVRLSATVVDATEDIKSYSITQRGCIFKEEATTLFGKKYSYSDCILDCRLKSMLALCQCVPFNFIKATEGPLLHQCTLIDIPCMNQYKEKWKHLYSLGYEGDDIELSKHISISCQQCFPSCSSTLYSVRNDFTFLGLNRNKILNYSIVNIFFESTHSHLYKQEVINFGFEIISTFGGTCSLIMGLSLISIVELLYYFTVVLCKNYVFKK